MLFTNLPKDQEDSFKIEIIHKIAENLPIIVVNAQGLVTAASECALTQLGLKPEDVMGRSVEDMVKNGYYSHSTSGVSLKMGQDYIGLTTDKRGKIGISNSHIIYDHNQNIKAVVSFVYFPNDISNTFEDIVTETKSYYSELQYLRKQLVEQSGNLIFKSRAMLEIVNKALQYASSDINILLTGESGTGKDVFAKLIHQNSPRRDKPFVPIFIPAISESLLEAELFGYEKGAYTNANAQGKPGLFEIANGGTVFLDEIGDIPLNLQVKLLRVLENQEIIRMGSTKSKKLDIRIISATNKDLWNCISRGNFRKDLLYRICGVNIMLPPLRERKDDIRPLAEHFLNLNNKKYGKKGKLTERAYQAMGQYSWPGNVRELKNVIEQLVIATDSPVISESDVQFYFFAAHDNSAKQELPAQQEPEQEPNPAMAREPSPAPAGAGRTDQPVYFSSARNRNRRVEQIIKALQDTDGSRTEAAQRLNVSRTTFYKWIKKYDIHIYD